ncbi:MAG: hypothetical protein ABFD96_09670 [Armatimonadia bacterium]
MHVVPDYDRARSQAGFGWSAGGSQGALRALTGTPIRDFNLDPDVCIDCFRRGRPLLHEMFGPDVGLPGVSTPAVSYGHPNCLGSELLFPENGEVAHTHIYGSLEQAIKALQEPVDWGSAGMAPFFLDFREKLQQAFPEEKVRLSFGAEGPLTTAYEVRGDGFFMEVHDRPELTQEFLRVLVDNTLDFLRWDAQVNERPAMNPTGSGMCDDIASFISPALFPTIVIPAWEQYYSGQTTGKRSAHVEDLNPAQLPFLETVGLSSFDPSISPKLTPRLVADHCRVPFVWRLGGFHYREMDEQEVEDFVFQSAADGASGVTTVIEEVMCTEANAAKVQAFIRAGKETKALLEQGCSREELGQRVSPAGREKLWDKWCGYNGPQSSRGGARVSA